ncbi:MAG: disulfide bond formation protein B [Gammaproteobacteria bacterium]
MRGLILPLLRQPLRLSFIACFVFCWSSLLIAYFYMEKYLLLAPCPLCILDRLVVAGMGFAYLALIFIAARPWRLALLAFNWVLLAAGFVFAGRHIWLQYRAADPAASCLSDTEAAKTFIEIIARAFDAKGDCGAVYWQFAGMSIPEQVLLMFAVFAAFLAWQTVQVWRA